MIIARIKHIKGRVMAGFTAEDFNRMHRIHRANEAKKEKHYTADNLKRVLAVHGIENLKPFDMGDCEVSVSDLIVWAVKELKNNVDKPKQAKQYSGKVDIQFQNEDMAPCACCLNGRHAFIKGVDYDNLEHGTETLDESISELVALQENNGKSVTVTVELEEV